MGTPATKLNTMDLHSLRVFLEAARALNFTEAGRTLGLSQPAVSMQIRSLEDYLGVTLFERSPKGISLTRAGAGLVPRAERIISMVIDTEESIHAATTEVSGELVIGCSATSAKYLVPHIVARFRELYPDVQVSIPVITRGEMMEYVDSGALDIGVSSMRVPDYDVNYQHFFDDHFVLVAPASHPWAHRENVEAHELFGEQFICREPESACRFVVGSGLAPLGLDMADLEIVMQIGSAEALAMAVEHGIGLAFVSVLAAMPRIALGRLAAINVAGVDLVNPVEIVTSNQRAASPAQTRFLEFVNQPQNRTMLQKMAEGGMV